ncbi:hypothetical protein AALO_G00010730 [Alosa alosa]|uniref:Uncharacterized protein n=1 Tax=Alosa alosa TaxID=278164 RepID=A0AAV6HJF8_9TELE|nr:uncharacterized protein LOC125304504 [Alosa alosa]KAG5286081.1 hypothetical protein AALO_G00010730 [Alosa alosa]
MSLLIRCMGFLSFLLLLSSSQYNLFAWVNHTNVHKALLDMLHNNNSKAIPTRPGDEGARVFWATWMPFPLSQEPDEQMDWWAPILQVLRIHNLKGWTEKEKGLIDHAWEKFWMMFKHTDPVKDMKQITLKRRKSKISPPSKISSGFSWHWFIVFVIAYIWKLRGRITSSEITIESLSEQLNTQTHDLEKMLELLQQMQESLDHLENRYNAISQTRRRRSRAQQVTQIAFSDSSISSD